MTRRLLLLIAGLALGLGCSAADEPETEPLPTDDEPRTRADSTEPAPTDRSDGPDLSEPFYGTDRVLDVSITIDPADWETLRNQTRSFVDILAGDCLDGPADDIFTWFEATVTVDGETLEKVGVRKKGFLGSLSRSKPSLKVRFDKFVDDQLLGDALKRLTLNNSRQDPSMLNTCLSYGVFAAAGIPAPRCGFATVSVNGEAYGLYVQVESIKKAFLRRHFENAEGNLYEGTMSDFRAGWSGTFEKKTNKTEADFSDIEQVSSALETSGDGGIAALDAIVDDERFLSFWATEVLVGHWDGYNGNRNNFMTYREPDGRFVFLPWGPDSAFRPLFNPFNGHEDPQAVMAASGIAHRLYKHPERQAAFVARLKSLLDSVWDEAALLKRVDELDAIVQANTSGGARAAAADDTKRVRAFIEGRRKVITAELEAGPVVWSWPLAPPDICWAEIGSVDIAFETTWGTAGAPNGLQKGSATITDYTVAGEAMSFANTGVTAGPNDPQDDNAEPRAIVTVLGLMSDGTLDALRMSLPLDSFAPGASIPLDLFTADTLRILVYPPTYTDFELVGRVAHGTVELEAAGTAPGDVIKGRLKGTLYDLGGGDE